MLRRVVLPNGKKLVFDPKWHTYVLDGHGKLRSVSKILNQFFPFDEAKVSKLVAQKTERTESEVLKEWKQTAELGRTVHSFVECKLKNIPPVAPKTEKEEKFFAEAEKAVENLTQHYDVVEVEYIVANPKYNCAGTIDFIAKSKKNPKKLLIGDWKTSGAALSNFRFGSFEPPATHPVSHLSNTKISRYALQVFLYGNLLQSGGYLNLPQFRVGQKKEMTEDKDDDADDDDKNSLDYGLIHLGVGTEGNVEVNFKKILPQEFLPACDCQELQLNEMLTTILNA